MSKFQFRALAVCYWLVALCFGIAGAAALETYFLFRGGPRVEATVTRVEPRPSHWPVTVSYVLDGKPQETELNLTGVAPGDVLTLALHENNHEEILERDLGSKLPSIWVIVGLVLSIALGVFLWRLPTRQAKRRAKRTSVREVLVDAAARTRNMSIGLGIFLVLTGALFAIVPYFDREGGVGAVIFIELLAALTVGLGGMLLVRAYRLRDPSNNPILDLIERRPDEIAWFHVLQVTSEGIQATESLNVQIWQSNGKVVGLALVRDDLDVVMAELARRAPHAQVGYDRAIEKLYKERPDRWRPYA
jgi:hypothetical protein